MDRKNVFINCPFDKQYDLLFHAIIFTVMYCGFNPRCALEVQDSSQTRFVKIKKIIADCQYGIHDISRTELDKNTNLSRFNMPLELGLFLGAKEYGTEKQKKKSCIVLDKEKFRFQKFMSDFAGNDIEAHDNTPKEAIATIRKYLNTPSKLLQGPTFIQKKYNDFQRAMPKICENLKLDHKNLHYNDFKPVVETWLELEKSSSQRK